MARRRLSPLPQAAGAAAGPEASGRAPTAADRDAPVPRAEHAAAPIARVAAEAAAASALDEIAETLRAARESGRMVLELPLDAVAPDHLLRDRLPREDPDMAALQASIRAHGQRAPIEVTPLEGPLPYGLISGWRRLAALRALHAETGEPRFGVVRALVTRPESAAAGYVAMVEENEIRVGLSQYERARVAALAARRGVFASEEAALKALFGAASRAKRSRIRSFLELYHAFDGVLRFPAHLPERLGLQLVEAVRAGRAAAIAEAVAAAAPATPEAEQALLAGLAARGGRTTRRPAEAEEIAPGVRLAARSGARSLTLHLAGDGVTAELRSAIVRAVRALGAGPG